MPLPGPAERSQPLPPPLRWDVFCRVVDNFGDVGLCWRLAARLADLGQTVRLWIDDATALAWMAPLATRPSAITVLPWRAPAPDETPGHVVVEAFGCDPPAAFLHAMRNAEQPPVWIDLEYLTAERYAERSHGLPSPQSAGPGAGLPKWFFYPGFTRQSGGLLCEDGLHARHAAFDAGAWCVAHGVDGHTDGSRLSLFCYDQPRIADAVAAWRPTQLLVTPGHASAQVARWLGLPRTQGLSAAWRHAGTSLHLLPWLSQADFDALLWSCDINFVRGEDSLVRALWAGRPFVWQLYPQHDGAHAAKLDAFLRMYCDGAEPALAAAIGRLFLQWNGLADGPLVTPEAAAWRRFAADRAERLRAQQQEHGDLALRLCRFVQAAANG